jgi:hypothetical protein
MIVKKVSSFQTCAICNRTLLLGEHSVRFAAPGNDWVEVCALCTEDAYGNGWIREGSPSTPNVVVGVRKRRLPRFAALLESRRSGEEPVHDEPMLRRLSQPEQAIMHAADQFNASTYRRTVAGILKSLGEPRVSFLPLSGTNPEVVITIAWEISWYQYRAILGTSQPMRLAERGYEIDDLDERFQVWNGSLDASGNVTPDIPRL